jgi:hypothetical protein
VVGCGVGAGLGGDSWRGASTGVGAGVVAGAGSGSSHPGSACPGGATVDGGGVLDVLLGASSLEGAVPERVGPDTASSTGSEGGGDVAGGSAVTVDAGGPAWAVEAVLGGSGARSRG